jgi:dihydrofolate synthase / folylpolyglutamate synthase
MGPGSEIRQRLFGLAAHGIKYDLERMHAAVKKCGGPQQAYPSFHIAGTNGKGSTCAYLESALRSCGFRTGLFTSPHLVDFEERFMVDGKPVPEAAWLHVYRDLQPIIEEFKLTFFEASALMAFEIFRRQKVEWAVIETGLGGRLDATNVAVPRVSIISRIAMDHREYLGNDLASIASEKLGIVKKNVPLVIAAPESREIKDLVVARCQEAGASCRFIAQADATDCATDAQGSSFAWNGRRIRINLPGAYQVGNALLALNALDAAGIEDHGAIARGFEAAWLPGRFQILTVRKRCVVFDVGHNPDAAGAFCRELQERFNGESVCMVLGIMKDKEIAGMMPWYASVARRIILTAPATERAARPEALRENIPAGFNGECSIASTVAHAVAAAFASPEEVICIAGSFFTVGEAMTYLKIDPYSENKD